MGAEKQKALNSRGKSGKHGAQNGGSGGFVGRITHSTGKRLVGEASWRAVDSVTLGWLIARATEEGCEITFGRSGDGGALKISLWDWKDRAVEYFPNSLDLNAEILSYAGNFVTEESDDIPLP